MFKGRVIFITIDYELNGDLFWHIDNLAGMFPQLRYSNQYYYKEEDKYFIVISDRIIFEKPVDTFKLKDNYIYKKLEAKRKIGEQIKFEYILTNISQEEFTDWIDKSIEQQEQTKRNKNKIDINDRMFVDPPAGLQVQGRQQGVEAPQLMPEQQVYYVNNRGQMHGQGVGQHIQEINELYNQVMDGVRNQPQA